MSAAPTRYTTFNVEMLRSGSAQIVGTVPVGSRALVVARDGDRTALLTVMLDEHGDYDRILGCTSVRRLDSDRLIDLLRAARASEPAREGGAP
jgi:hypothetical protein